MLQQWAAKGGLCSTAATPPPAYLSRPRTAAAAATGALAAVASGGDDAADLLHADCLTTRVLLSLSSLNVFILLWLLCTLASCLTVRPECWGFTEVVE